MDALLNGAYSVFQAFIGAGAYVMLPFIIMIIGLIFRLPISKAFKSGITITCTDNCSRGKRALRGAATARDFRVAALP